MAGIRIDQLGNYASFDPDIGRKDLFEVSKNSGTYASPVYASDGSRKITLEELSVAVASQFTATNGLTKTGSNIKLGGTLVEHTFVNGADLYDLQIGDGNPGTAVRNFDVFATNYANIQGSSTSYIFIDSTGVSSEAASYTFSGTGATLNIDATSFRFHSNGGGSGFYSRLETSLLTANRTHQMPDASGTLALQATTLAGYGITDAYTQAQVDAFLTGIDWKEHVEVATTANITLSGEQTIDGFLTSASRILVKDNTDQTENGIYLTDAGAWTRVSDANTGDELISATVYILNGTVNGEKVYTCSNTGVITIGVTNITFALINAGNTYTNGAGLDLTGNVFSIAAGGVTDVMLAAMTSAQFAAVISDETGSGALVFGTSPEFTTSVTTASSTFNVFNTNATTVNFAGAASTALNIGHASGVLSFAPTSITLAASTVITASGTVSTTLRNGAANSVVIDITKSAAATANTLNFVGARILGTYSPSTATSTGSFYGLQVGHTINQGASNANPTGGVHVRPILTNVYGTYASVFIETPVPSGGTGTVWGVYQSVSGIDNYFNGQILMGGTSRAASATNTLHVYSGTPPAGNITDGILMYSDDIAAGNAVTHFQSENGDTQRIYSIGGWGTPTGALTRTTFDTTTVTTEQLAERVAALISDLKTGHQFLKA